MSAKAVVALQSESGSNVYGTLTLSQASEDSPTLIVGQVKGLSVGKHGISINTFGDLSNGAASCGPTFNPFSQPHGLPDTSGSGNSSSTGKIAMGALGNILGTPEQVTAVEISSSLVKLLGPHSVIGRSFVIYASEDDGGRGGHELSLTTGNTGPRVAAGVIGIAAAASK